jgi:hypothetical protein
MSQRDVEGTLGRLLTDTAFRVRFFTHPAATVAREGLSLSHPELRLLERVPVYAVLELASHIDGSLRRFEAPSMPNDTSH